MEPNKFTSMLHKKSNKITRILIYVVLEWTLIFLLLLNSLFSYIILKFAVYYGLKPPCFLCSRLDHVLDSKNSKKKSISSYKEFICSEHASEISNIWYCLPHRKLVESKNVCHVCSQHDDTLFKWINEIGIHEENDVIKKCSCCDEIIKPKNISSNKYIGFMANIITERELNGCFVEHEQGDSDEYQILDDEEEDEEEDDDNDDESEVGVVLEDEKQPLLSINDDIINEDEDEDGGGGGGDMIAQQHLEFYVDHDDYRLIPVEIVGETVKNERNFEESSKKDESLEEFCKDVDLVFEAEELMAACCKVNAKNLPSIQEDGEEDDETGEKQVEEHSQVLEFDEEKVAIEEVVAAEVGEQAEKQVEEHSQVLEFDEKKREIEELVAAEVGEQAEKQVEVHLQVLEIAQEFDEEKRDTEELVADELAEKQVEEHSQVLEFVAEKRDIEEWVAAEQADKHLEEHSQVLEFTPECDEEKRAIEKLLADEVAKESAKQVEEHSQVLEFAQEYDEEKRETEELVADEVAEKQVEVHSQVLEFAQEFNEEKTGLQDLVAAKVAEKQVEEHSQVLELTGLQEKDHSTVSESASVLQGMVEDSREIDAENGVHSPSAVNKEEIEAGIEKNENVTQEVLIEVDERLISCENECPTIIDNGVCEAALPSTDENDAEVNEESLNVDVVGMSINETEDDKIPDTPNSTGSPNVQKKLMLLGRSRSITEESLDGSIISEHEGVDGATLVEKLKLELHTEKKTLRALYAELEEERNASAIAANQTMAMINRLQEEKATMQMEALQYQRMMEEQSEYDQEALQMMNELMVKREKEKQELEKEVEVYRKKLLDFEEREKVRILSRRMEGSVRSRNSSASCSYGEESDGLSIDLNHDVKEHEEESGVSPNQDTPNDAFLGLQESLGGFEDERMSILEQLKVLEDKLFSLAKEEEDENEDEEDIVSSPTRVNGKHEERWPNGSMQKRLLPLFDEAELLDSTEEITVNKSHSTKFELEKKRVAIEEEVDHVYERLHALEADREFLKHCIGSLRKGDKGLDLLQEILQHLRDLKNVELHVMKNMDPCSSV